MGLRGRSGARPGREKRPATARRPCLQAQEVLSLSSRLLHSVTTRFEVQLVLFTSVDLVFVLYTQILYITYLVTDVLI